MISWFFSKSKSDHLKPFKKSPSDTIRKQTISKQKKMCQARPMSYTRTNTNEKHKLVDMGKRASDITMQKLCCIQFWKK